MHLRMGLLAVLWSAVLGQTVFAQPNDNDARLDAFERRLTELEQRYKADLEARDEEIAKLRSQLAEQRAPTTAPATAAVAGDSPDEIEQTRQAVLRDIEARERAPLAERLSLNFNPDIAVIGDLVGSVSGNRDNDAYNRFDAREVELDLRAAIHPRADGVVILAFERDVHNPVFPETHEDGDEHDEEGGPESSVNLEEAYVFLHDFGVPNLTAKLGRFHLRFGRQNLLHLHNLPTTDPPLVNQAFLAPESLNDAGVSFSYLIPNPWDAYIEGVVEIVTGEGADSESPTLAGDLSVDSPAVNAHLLWNTDLSRDWNLELGGSWLAGHRDADNALDAQLLGADLTLIRTDPTGGFFNQLLQAELIYGDLDLAGSGGDTAHSLGAYLLAQQQLNRDWYVGLRLDWTENPDNDDEEAWAVSPYVSWYWSEFLRFRLQYQHRDGDIDAEDILYFQTTFVFGAHPPHPYWSMK